MLPYTQIQCSSSGEPTSARRASWGFSSPLSGHLHIKQDAHMQKSISQRLQFTQNELTGFTPTLVLKEIYTKSQNQRWQLCLLDVFPVLPVTDRTNSR